MSRDINNIGRENLVVFPLGNYTPTRDWSGVTINLATILRPIGRNYKKQVVYLCRDVFGEEFTCAYDRFHKKGFALRGGWCESSNQKIKKLTICYSNMLNRCLSADRPDSKYYSEKGVTVCDEWLGPKGRLNFIRWAAKSGYQVGLEIDRTAKNYEPSTCRWISHLENFRACSKCTITLEIAQKVREAYKNWNGTQKDFCKHQAFKYGVGFNAIYFSLIGKTWKENPKDYQ